MADVDHPKTHVENDKEVELPRTQPESPQHEGIDPLTEGDTMYPSEDTKSESEKLDQSEADEAEETVGTPDADTSANDETTADQEERNAKANTPDANLPDEDKTAPGNQPSKDGDDGAAPDPTTADPETPEKTKSQERREAASK